MDYIFSYFTWSDVTETPTVLPRVQQSDLIKARENLRCAHHRLVKGKVYCPLEFELKSMRRRIRNKNKILTVEL